MLTKMQKWGNSQGLRIPKIILEETKIGVGDEVEVLVKSGKIIVEPILKPPKKYDIRELVSQITEDFQHSEYDWGKPQGKEEW